jgi:hypothetical protein
MGFGHVGAIATRESAGVTNAVNPSMPAGRFSPFFALLCALLFFSMPLAAAAANRAPQISGSAPTSAAIGKIYSFTPSASDPDRQTLKFRIKNKPAWAYFSTTTGRLRGTPRSAGTYSNIVISVTDGRISRSLPAFSIRVGAANRPPSISGTPKTVALVGRTYSFTPRASDPDGQSLRFSISNKPAWASFSSTTGRLSGWPRSASAASSSKVVISVSDGVATKSLAPFAIAVVRSENLVPVISGTAVRSATVGQPYSFRPVGSDPDGDPLRFSISNKPAWATFDVTNGTLYGTPSSAGTFSNVSISVSDGQASAGLSPFSITVAATATRAVTLSWTPPTTNVDGTPLTTLTGYRIHYGMAPGRYDQSVPVSSPALRSAVIEGLATGRTWYFAVKAIAGGGVESDYSREVSKALP